MTGDSGSDLVRNIVGGIVSVSIPGGLGALFPQLVPLVGEPTADLVVALGVVAGLVFFIVFIRYAAILGAGGAAPASRERDSYDALRTELNAGGYFGALYVKRLTAFLEWVDRFFGDAGMADRSLFPRAFWLKTSAPLWTAPAFDRCLLLALLYPILAIFVIWGIFGHVGPAERVLGLAPNVALAKRLLTLGLLAGAAIGYWNHMRTEGWQSIVWLAIAIAIAIAVAVAGAVAVLFLNERASGRGRQGRFLSLFMPAMIALCLVAAWFLSSAKSWEMAGPLLLFLGLLTLLNAPFDWVSLGLTRGLLRKGIELEGWAPYWLALIDAALASVLIVMLVATMLVGVQAFDDLAVMGGGKAVLPLEALIDGIATRPAEPEYHWVYALLLTTMVPSVINLTIGWASLFRGIPGVPRLLLARMPENDTVLEWDRNWMAIVLTAQWPMAVILAVLVQGFLVWGVLGDLLPRIGFGLLDLGRVIVAADLPMQFIRLFR